MSENFVETDKDYGGYDVHFEGRVYSFYFEASAIKFLKEATINNLTSNDLRLYISYPEEQHEQVS